MVLGDIDEAGEPDHGIEEEALSGVAGALPFALGDIVDECERERQVADRIADAALHGGGHDLAIHEGGGAQDDRVEHLVDGEDNPVQRLQRVAVGNILRFLAGARRQRRGESKEKNQKDRARHCAHSSDRCKALVGIEVAVCAARLPGFLQVL